MAVAIPIVLAAVLYVMVSGLVGTPEGPGAIGITHADTSTNWVLRVDSIQGMHSITTTTFLMRWASNASVVSPPGLATLESLETPSGGVQYLPVNGASQTVLRVADVIAISKAAGYTAGMQVTISGGSTILWTGTL